MKPLLTKRSSLFHYVSLYQLLLAPSSLQQPGTQLILSRYPKSDRGTQLVKRGSGEAENLSPVLMRIQVLKNVTLWGWVCGFRRFEGTTFLRNVSERSLNDTTSYPRRLAFLTFFRSDQPSQDRRIRLAMESFPTGYSSRKVKETTHLHLAHRLKSVKMYLYFPIRLLGVVLNTRET